MAGKYDPLLGEYREQDVSPAPYYQYIYNSSGPQLGNVFNDWADMLDAIDGREARIQFQQNEVLPVGNWNIDYHIWIGNGQNPDGGGLIIEFPEGCYIDSALNWSAQNGLNLYSSSSTHPTYTMTVPHIFLFDRTAVYTDTIEFVNIQCAGLVAVSCINGFGLYKNPGAGIGDYEVFNIDSSAYATVFVTTEQGIAPVIQADTIRSTVPIVYGWLKQSSEANSTEVSHSNLAPFSVNFNGDPGGNGYAVFANAKVVGFLQGQPNGIPEANVADALAGLVSSGVTQVVHGSDNTVVRPDYWKMVIWIGTVEPDNMAVNDLWINA